MSFRRLGISPKKIEFFPYELRPVSRLSSRASQASRQGALLRIEFEDGGKGHADCFPWPELEDAPLPAQLASLRGELTPLTRQSVFFARLEAKALTQKISLFEGQKLPDNHFLWIQDLALLEERLSSVWAEGFSKIKIKIGSDLEREKVLIKKLSLKLSENQLRVDFNHSLDADSFKNFLKEMDSVLPVLDWIEDPCPYDPVIWKKIQSQFPIRLALDRFPENTILEKKSFKVLVVKPALLDWEEAFDLAEACQVSLAFTSYLDHPLGQLTAAYSAAKAYERDPDRLEVGGLLSQKAYEPTFFSNWLSSSGPSLHFPRGSGWGLGLELDALCWQKLEA